MVDHRHRKSFVRIPSEFPRELESVHVKTYPATEREVVLGLACDTKALAPKHCKHMSDSSLV